MNKQRNQMQTRLSYLLFGAWCLMLVLIVRVAWLQLVDGSELKQRAIVIAEENRSRQSPRGKITDRNGREQIGRASCRERV